MSRHLQRTLDRMELAVSTAECEGDREEADRLQAQLDEFLAGLDEDEAFANSSANR